MSWARIKDSPGQEAGIAYVWFCEHDVCALSRFDINQQQSF